jgi:glucose-1-phosphate cytidylyltransferase
MKVVILAGGLGTRLAEETELRPKPMVEIGGYPILWHIMRHYVCYGFDEFIVALGYKGDVVKRYFLDYYALRSNSLTISLKHGEKTKSHDSSEDWLVHLVDTGLSTNTGGRVKRLEPLLSEGTFMLTYGDGVCNVNLQEVLAFHRSHGRCATVTAVRPPARFGSLDLDGDRVMAFVEKSQTHEGWINGGFFVFEPGIFNYLLSDETVLESDALEQLARDGELMAYCHSGFWQCMDTLRDKRYLENLWQTENAPWKLW